MKKLKLFVVVLFFSNLALGQNDKDVFYDIVEEDKIAVDALALYPEETRNAILTASTQPEVIMQLERIQSKVSKEFVRLIDNKSKEEQRAMYELSRYDGLIEKIASQKKKKTEEELRQILKDYPQEIHETAMEMGRKNHGLIYASNVLYQSANTSFENVLAPLDEEVKQAYRHLIQLPEVIDILSENMRLTVAVGGLYQRDPQWVKSRLDSLNLEAARANAKEAEEWKKTLEENPEVLEEFQSSAERYANDRGYSEEEYRREQEPVRTVVYHHYYSYDYWFGYPYWYPYAFWYRWPVWYDWGFYYGPGGAMVLTGLPSFYFTYWHFAYPRHHFYYPHLSSTFVSHYRNHPRSTTGVSAGVSSWVNDNRNKIPSNFLADDGQRVQRMREYGLFETEYQERVADRGARQVSREEYLQRNSDRFRTLARPGIEGAEQPLRGQRPGERQRRGTEGEAGVPQRGRADGEARDPRFHDPASPEMQRRRPQERQVPDRGVERQIPPERQRPMERQPQTQPAPRQQVPQHRQAPVERRRPQQAPQRAPQPAPRQTPPSPSPAQPPASRPSPGDDGGSSHAPRARPMSIIIAKPENGQSVDRGRIHHQIGWNR